MKDEAVDVLIEDEQIQDETPEQILEREQAEAEAAKKEPAISAAEFKRVERELKESRKLSREHEENARYWAGQAKREPATREAEADDNGKDPADEIDIVSELTTNGARGLAKVLDKLGYVKAKDVDQRIGATRAEITQDAQLISQYPDLADQDSSFFKATAKIYGTLKGDMPHSKAIAVAARLAKAEAGTGPRRRPDPEIDDQIEDEPDERAQRIARQSGDRGARGADGDGKPRLDAMQKQIVASLRAAGADITEESYLKRALAGVRMGGLPSARRRAA